MNTLLNIYICIYTCVYLNFDIDVDRTIIQTSLREMEEEMGIPKEKVEVLGVLRCNWHEVASMTGIAVTPVVGFIGER
jgi:hypothetical protein